MQNLLMLGFLYALFSFIIGAVIGMGHVLNDERLYTPYDFIRDVKSMDNIQIYHILVVFGILPAIVYYIAYPITFLIIKIGKITIYKKR